MVRAPKKPRYSPHPALGMEAKAKEKLAATSGKSFDAWVAFAQKKGPKTHRELRQWLRAEHGVSSMNSYWLASAALGEEATDYGDPEPLVDALYSGAKAALRPLHESLVDEALALGGDVVVTACKTMVPCYRKHSFAEFRPVEGGVAVELALGDVKAKGRLGAAPNRAPGDRMTHRVVVSSARDIDDDFRGWLRKAYEAGAGKIARKAAATVPADFRAALAASAAATATWATCTPAMQRDFVVWIEQAKQAETRARRISLSVEKLAAGKRRTY